MFDHYSVHTYSGKNGMTEYVEYKCKAYLSKGKQYKGEIIDKWKFACFNDKDSYGIYPLDMFSPRKPLKNKKYENGFGRLASGWGGHCTITILRPAE